jgi:hypothetical protein
VIHERHSLIVLLALSGCHSYLVPFDARPLPARSALPTKGGERIDLDTAGGLVLRPGAGDVASALGASLYQTDGGLVVTNRLRPGSPLQPGDVLLHVAARVPGDGQQVRAAHELALKLQALGLANSFPDGPTKASLDTLAAGPRSLWEQFLGFPGKLPAEQVAAGAFDTFEPGAATPDTRYLELLAGSPARLTQPALADPPPTPASVRARPSSHPVETIDDLRPYLVGAGWVELDLVVDRGGTELVVRQRPEEAVELLPVRTWNPELTHWHGLELVRLADWPLERRPRHANPSDLLVVRVARDAPAGRAGLRPLDTVPLESLPGLLGEDYRLEATEDDPHQGPAWKLAELPGDSPVLVRGPDGEERALEPFEAREPATDLWFPFLFSYQNDGVRMHLGIGLLDSVFHFSRRRDYVPSTDSYTTTWRFAFSSAIQGATVDTPEGVRRTAGINAFHIDGARLDYWAEWFQARGEREHRWLGLLGSRLPEAERGDERGRAE